MSLETTVCNSQPYYVLLYLACFEDKSYMDFCWVFEQDQSRMVEESCAFETNLERPTCESIIFQFTTIYPTRSCSNRSLRSANCCWAAAAWTGLRNGQSHSRCHPKILLSKVKVWWALTNINKLYIYCICVTLWHTTINFLLGAGPFKTRECSDVIGSLWTLPICWLWFKLASNLSATMQNGVHNDYMLPINVLLAISDSLKCLLSWRTHFLGLDALIITEKVITDHSTYHYLYTIATTTMLLSARVLSHSPRCCN